MSCYCQRVHQQVVNDHSNLRVLKLSESDSCTYTSSYLYLAFNVHNSVYALFSEAQGEDSTACSVKISFCPFCGRDLRNNQGGH